MLKIKKIKNLKKENEILRKKLNSMEYKANIAQHELLKKRNKYYFSQLHSELESNLWNPEKGNASKNLTCLTKNGEMHSVKIKLCTEEEKHELFKKRDIIKYDGSIMFDSLRNNNMFKNINECLKILDELFLDGFIYESKSTSENVFGTTG